MIHRWQSSKSLEIATCCTSCSTLLLIGKVSIVSGKIETKYRGDVSSNTILMNNCCKKGFLDGIEKKSGKSRGQLINYKVRFFFII